jgi:hypothetical protein
MACSSHPPATPIAAPTAICTRRCLSTVLRAPVLLVPQGQQTDQQGNPHRIIGTGLPLKDGSSASTDLAAAQHGEHDGAIEKNKCQRNLLGYFA